MPAIIDVRASLGAILVGCFIAIALSGVVAFQACIYFRLYPSDKPLYKYMVGAVWLLDITHTCFICSSVWNYLISNYGNVEGHVRGDVPTTVALSIITTSLVTLITHLFFLRRLLYLSKYNWYIFGPTLVLAIARVASAMVTSTFLIHLKTFPAFTAKYSYMFTLGLAISSAVDVVITFGMCFYLQESRRGFGTMDEVIDSIIIYTINNGTLTCLSTIVSMVFWLTMRKKNLVFMALHFVIAKMYANSLLGTLNMRRKFRGRAVPPRETANPRPVVLSPDSFNRGNRNPQNHIGSIDLDETMTDAKGLHITVEKTVQYDVDDDLASGPSSDPDSPPIYPLTPSTIQV